MLAPPQKPVEIFVSYASEDEELRRELEKHLLPLKRVGMITSWANDITAGTNVMEEIHVHLESAQIILLLVSPDYMASDDIYNNEIRRALERQDNGGALVIPILLRPVDLQESPFSHLQALPSSALPVTRWPDRDLAFEDIIKHIRSVVDSIINPSQQSASPPSSNNSASPLSSNNKVVQAIMRQRGFEKEAIRKNATADVPIQDIAKDELDFDDYVHALHDFIASQETSTPLTIGVHGKWGSGKSSLMRMLQKQLDRSLSFQEKLQRMTWMFFFFVTLPIWLYGHLLLLIFPLRFMNLFTFLVLDKDSGNIPPQTLNFWQKIRAWHNPVDPPVHPTIWFNAWKFDQEEQLWAALALEILDQMKQKQNFFQRIIFWFRLTYKRFSLVNFIKAVALPLFFAIIDWIYSSYPKQLPSINMNVFGYQIALGQLLLWAGIAISALIQILKIANDPFQIDVKNVFDKPNYKDKVGFLGSFEKDFSHIVSLITKSQFGWKPQKLVIFIDDLDRCKAPKSADIIEGINLFLDSIGCVFVLGMDLAVVAASIETKYSDLFKKIQEENAEVVSPGKLFLDKIIQVPFHVPPSTIKGKNQLVESIIQPEQHFVPFQQKQAIGTTKSPDQQRQTTSLDPTSLLIQANKPDPGSYKLKDVSDAIRKAAQFLSENPRQVKRFINLFRLYIYIVDARHLVRFAEDDSGKEQIGLTLKRLAIWVVWSMRWAEIVKFLHDEALLSKEGLRDYLLEISKKVHEDGSWTQDNESAYEDLLGYDPQILNPGKAKPGSWYRLPWEHWLLEEDFLGCIKEMETFWRQPQPNEDDWLHIILTMNRITFPTDIHAADSDSVKAKTVKLTDIHAVDNDTLNDPPNDPFKVKTSKLETI